MLSKWFWFALELLTLVAVVSSLQCLVCDHKSGPSCDPQKKVETCPTDASYHCFSIVDHADKKNFVRVSSCGHPDFLKKLKSTYEDSDCGAVSGAKIVEVSEWAKTQNIGVQRLGQERAVWENSTDHEYYICTCHEDECNKEGASSLLISQLVIGIGAVVAIWFSLFTRHM